MASVFSAQSLRRDQALLTRPLFYLLVCLMIAGCEALPGNAASRPTLEAELTALADESTRIATAGDAFATEVARTVQAAETNAASLTGINRQLVVTLRAVVPPTQQVIARSGDVTPGYNEPLPGQEPLLVSDVTQPAIRTDMSGVNQFAQITTALGISTIDGCALTPQTTFSTTVSRIYVTARVLNITGGTSVFVEWRYNDQLVATSTTYTVPEDDPDFCLWFYLEPSDVPFQAGSWSAQFYANGMPISPTADFVLN